MIQLFPAREIVLHIGNISIRWYGLLYAVAFWLAWLLLPHLQKYRQLSLSRDEWTYLLAWGVGGVLVGGRLGYVLLYEPAYFLQHPLEIFMLWQGGMASHGGFMGAAAALWYASRKLHVPFLSVLDIAAAPVAIGLALGRTGNFINQELYPEPVIFFVIASNLAIAALCYEFLKKNSQEGKAVALFLILYSIQRFFFEFYRTDGWVAAGGMTWGQLYTLPLLLMGIILLSKTTKGKNSSSAAGGVMGGPASRSTEVWRMRPQRREGPHDDRTRGVDIE